MSEFNLSEKEKRQDIRNFDEFYINGELKEDYNTIIQDVFFKEDVKKFINKLKEDINNPSGWVNCSVNNINRIIDKRAGDKLTGEKENNS